MGISGEGIITGAMILSEIGDFRIDSFGSIYRNIPKSGASGVTGNVQCDFSGFQCVEGDDPLVSD